MKIRKNRGPDPCELAAIKQGNCFLADRVVYLRTHLVDSHNGIGCVILGTGYVQYIQNDEIVHPYPLEAVPVLEDTE